MPALVHINHLDFASLFATWDSRAASLKCPRKHGESKAIPFITKKRSAIRGASILPKDAFTIQMSCRIYARDYCRKQILLHNPVSLCERTHKATWQSSRLRRYEPPVIRGICCLFRPYVNINLPFTIHTLPVIVFERFCRARYDNKQMRDDVLQVCYEGRTRDLPLLTVNKTTRLKGKSFLALPTVYAP